MANEVGGTSFELNDDVFASLQTVQNNLEASRRKLEVDQDSLKLLGGELTMDESIAAKAEAEADIMAFIQTVNEEAVNQEAEKTNLQEEILVDTNAETKALSDELKLSYETALQESQSHIEAFQQELERVNKKAVDDLAAQEKALKDMLAVEMLTNQALEEAILQVKADAVAKAQALSDKLAEETCAKQEELAQALSEAKAAEEDFKQKTQQQAEIIREMESQFKAKEREADTLLEQTERDLIRDVEDLKDKLAEDECIKQEALEQAKLQANADVIDLEQKLTKVQTELDALKQNIIMSTPLLTNSSIHEESVPAKPDTQPVITELFQTRDEEYLEPIDLETISGKDTVEVDNTASVNKPQTSDTVFEKLQENIEPTTGVGLESDPVWRRGIKAVQKQHGTDIYDGDFDSQTTREKLLSRFEESVNKNTLSQSAPKTFDNLTVEEKSEYEARRQEYLHRRSNLTDLDYRPKTAEEVHRADCDKFFVRHQMTAEISTDKNATRRLIIRNGASNRKTAYSDEGLKFQFADKYSRRTGQQVCEHLSEVAASSEVQSCLILSGCQNKMKVVLELAQSALSSIRIVDGVQNYQIEFADDGTKAEIAKAYQLIKDYGHDAQELVKQFALSLDADPSLSVMNKMDKYINRIIGYVDVLKRLETLPNPPFFEIASEKQSLRA